MKPRFCLAQVLNSSPIGVIAIAPPSGRQAGVLAAQLTVPVIALAGGVLFLGAAITPAFVPALALVLGGVALSVLAPRRQQKCALPRADFCQVDG